MKVLPAIRYFRRAILVAVALLLALFFVVRVQQYVFRSRAERLHAEVLALQLHPGSFLDIQTLQREWGAHGHYNGPCTQHHCIYEITVYDGLDDWFRKPPDSFPYFGAMRSLFPLKAYAFFGGRPGYADANVRVRDDRMWGADFALEIMTYPGKGRNEGEPYVVLAVIGSGSRLSHRDDLNMRDQHRGFRLESELNCLGCEFVEAFVTPQTNVSDIERFNHLNFSCITAILACKHPVDLAPEVWNQALKDKQDQPGSEEQACGLPIRILAREANDIVLAKIQSLKRDPKPGPGRPDQWVTVQIIKPLKNGRDFPGGINFDFVAGPSALRPEHESPRAQLAVGGEYYFLYRKPRLYELTPNAIDDPCHILPSTPENAASIREGVALDPSNGEPYDFRNEPYSEK